MQFETITKLLNLEPMKVIEDLDCNDDNLHLVVECGLRIYPCPVGVFLYIEKRKCRCDDGRILVEEYPWLRKRFTRRCAE